MSDKPVPELKPLSLKPWMQNVIVLALVAGAAVWFGPSRRADAEEASAKPMPAALSPDHAGAFALSAEQLATLTVETVMRREFHEEILTEGKIGVDEHRVTPVFSPYPGRVVQIFSRIGDYVKQGQQLFSVQANEMVQAQNDFLAALNALNKARSHLGFAQAGEKRQTELFSARVTTLRDLQFAQNELSVATNDLKTAQVGLEAVRSRLRILGLRDADMTALTRDGAINPETTINAPLSGTIIQRKIGPGQYVSTGGGDPSYVIGDLSYVWLIAHLRESDIAKVHIGEGVKFRVPAYPDKTFEGRIDFIGSMVDPASRRIYVRAEIDNGLRLLKPDMYASVRVISNHETLSPSVPRAAVIFEGEKATIWVLRGDDTVESRRIRPGVLDGNDLEVLGGVRAGERVIVRGALFVDRLASSN